MAHASTDSRMLPPPNRTPPCHPEAPRGISSTPPQIHFYFTTLPAVPPCQRITRNLPRQISGNSKDRADGWDSYYFRGVGKGTLPFPQYQTRGKRPRPGAGASLCFLSPSPLQALRERGIKGERVPSWGWGYPSPQQIRPIRQSHEVQFRYSSQKPHICS